MPRSARKESGYGIYHVMMFSHHADDPNVGLSLNEDLGKYKMFLNDTGLFITLAFWDKDVTENDVRYIVERR